MQHWPHQFTTPHAQSSQFFFISAPYLCLSCLPVLSLLVALYLTLTRPLCPHLGCWGWVLLKAAEQNQSKLLQHLFVCNASGAAVDFLNNTFKWYFKKVANKIDAMCLHEIPAAMARLRCAAALLGLKLLFKNGHRLQPHEVWRCRLWVTYSTGVVLSLWFLSWSGDHSRMSGKAG